MEYVGAALICIGLLFLFVAAIGMVRLPDVYSRSHAVAVTDSLGAAFLLTGLALQQGFTANALRIMVVLGLLYVLNPVISHATIRAARRAGVKPWTREKT